MMLMATMTEGRCCIILMHICMQTEEALMLYAERLMRVV